MGKSSTILLASMLTLSMIQAAEMKCGAGKCGSSMNVEKSSSKLLSDMHDTDGYKIMFTSDKPLVAGNNEIAVALQKDGPEFKSEVQFEEDSTSMLQLPKTAVLKKADKYYVFVPVGKEGQFEPKEITAKRVSAKSYEILSGLSEGEKVIDNALFMLDSDAVTNALYESEDEDW